MEIPSFCYDHNDGVTYPLLYSISQQKVRGFDFYQVIYFTFLAQSWKLLPHGEIRQQNLIYF